MASSSRSALSTLHTLARSLPSAASSATPASSLAASSLSSRPYGGRQSTAVQHAHQHQQVRHASFSGSFLRNLIPRRRAKKDEEAETTAAVSQAAKPAEQQEAAPKGLFDTVTEDEDVLQTQQRSGLVARPPKPVTFVRPSRSLPRGGCQCV